MTLTMNDCTDSVTSHQLRGVERSLHKALSLLCESMVRVVAAESTLDDAHLFYSLHFIHIICSTHYILFILILKGFDGLVSVVAAENNTRHQAMLIC